MFRILYFQKKKKRDQGFYISKKKCSRILYFKKRFRILKLGIGLKMQLRALLSSAWLGGRVQLIFQKKKDLYFKKKVQGFIFQKKGRGVWVQGFIFQEKVQGFIFQKKGEGFGFRDLYFKKKGEGFGFKVLYLKKKFKDLYFNKKKGGGFGFRDLYFKKKFKDLYFKKKGEGFGFKDLYFKKKGEGFGFKDLCSKIKFMFKKSKVCNVKDLCSRTDHFSHSSVRKVF
eukprot:snap_masked-scaffold_9-processed-gene-13.76-mRNA-1 protein AED:1.00 eAED:1.00 QI:0/0/0/0/1/1/2/0/226